MGGVSHQKVLAEKGRKGPLNNRGANAKLQVTASVTSCASGEIAQIIIVHKGERLLAGPGKKHLKNLDSGPHMPEVDFFVAPKGCVTRAVFYKIMVKLVEWCVKKEREFPILVWVDNFDGHKSLKISTFCRENRVYLLGNGHFPLTQHI